MQPFDRRCSMAPGTRTLAPERRPLPHTSRLTRWWLVALAVGVGAPGVARPATLTVTDALISSAECVNRSGEAVKLSWDFGSSSGSSIEILGSNTSACPSSSSSSSYATAVLVDGLSASRTYYPQSGDSGITLSEVLSAAGTSPGSCDGSDFRVYVCVRLLDGSGAEVATASATIKFQLARPPPPTGLTVGVGEQALYVTFSPGTSTTDAPAAPKSYQAFASAGGVTHGSSETTGTRDVRIPGLENGTTYDVWVVAYSEAGNPSDRSELSAGTPQHVLDFYEMYRSAGGSETGGCSAGGDAGFLTLLALGWFAASARFCRRTSR
jgi:hypothetical protein